MDTLDTNRKRKIMWKAWVYPIILLVIIISHSSCFTNRKLSFQYVDRVDSSEVRNPENHILVEGKGKLRSYTMLSGTTHKIHRISSYFIYQDTLRLILSGSNPEEKEIYYNVPVSKLDFLTFRKFSFWKTSLIPGGLLAGSLCVLLIGLMNWHD
jgi:hypothetical protein